MTNSSITFFYPNSIVIILATKKNVGLDLSEPFAHLIVESVN